MLYKSKLPMVLCFNKIDVAPHQFAVEWMEDFEKFQVPVLAPCCGPRMTKRR